MATNSDKDFQSVRDKVNRVDQRMEEVVLPALDEIKLTLSKMSFLPKEDYIKDMAELAIWKTKVEKFMADAKPIVNFGIKLNSRWTQILIGVLILGFIYIIGTQINKLGIF